ncbi:MAG: S8 family serine peptidase, partial [Sedimentisphaerales bacterium]|nr:S8 family serine peptidase [Sedimentisphaerales bacterium]
MVFSHRKAVSHLTILAALLSFWCSISSGMTLTTGVGRPAPDFSLETLDGQTVNLSLLKGGNILLLFGATWCPHCRAALGILEDICDSAGDDLIVFFVPVGQSVEELNDYFRDTIPPYLIVLDENSELGRRFGIKRIPVCTFIDEAGVILHKGRFDQTIVRRLLSGERLTYSGGSPEGPAASGRLAQKPDAPDAAVKRYFVELDEDQGLAERLSKAGVDTKRAQYRRAVERIGGRVIHDYGKLKNRIVVEISSEQTDKLKQLPRFKKFEEDSRVHVLLEDSAYQIRADYAWDNAITGQGVKVCVVDTGIDYTHPDLQNKVIAQYDATGNTSDAMDDQGHGTHVAGIIASEGLQYRGGSYDVLLMAAKVLDYTGSGYSSDVELGIQWCVEEGADVINLSLGEGLYSGTCDYDEMAQAVNAAVEAGVVVTCAAGNDGDLGRMVSPACASKVIAVGAVDKVDGIASYSDGGSELDLVAPGGEEMGGKNFPEIVSAYSTEVAENPLYCMYQIDEECYDEYFLVDGTRYIRAVGTSMAAPHVAAAAALLLEENPSLSPAQVKTVLEQNADDLGDAGWDATFGWGRINIEKALENIPPETAELMVEITEPNASDQFTVKEQFGLAAKVDCYGGDGCGQVLVHAQFCEGRDCNDFVDMNALTTFSTLENNPNSLGILSGYTVETDVNVVFDAQTVLDISQDSYTKSINPVSSLVGSTMQVQYNSGDLEPRDGVGAIGEDAQEHYSFELPGGAAKILKVRMENYIVLHAVYPPFAGWYVYTSNAAGDNLHLVGDCVPAEGGGGETPSPDCWFISDDPSVLADLNTGGASYIKLVSHDVEDDGIGQDWLTFNDIEVIVEYEPDPDNDEVYEYYMQFELADVNAANELTAARLKINVAQGASEAVAEVYVVDGTLTAGDSARAIHEANDVNYPGLVNPIKTFSGEGTGTISLNVKAAVEEALAAGQSSVAFQIGER